MGISLSETRKRDRKVPVDAARVDLSTQFQEDVSVMKFSTLRLTDLVTILNLNGSGGCTVSDRITKEEFIKGFALDDKECFEDAQEGFESWVTDSTEGPDNYVLLFVKDGYVFVINS